MADLAGYFALRLLCIRTLLVKCFQVFRGDEELHEWEQQILAQILESPNVRNRLVGREYFLDVHNFHNSLKLPKE